MSKKPDYLDTSIDWNDPNVVSGLDELPLWSAPFGLMLLENLRIQPDMTVLDVGFGTGFPLLELAQRLGHSATIYGIDPWKSAHELTLLKMKHLNIKNVILVEGDAASMPFEDKKFDLIVSNLGINNFENPRNVFKECFRVAKPKAQIALTTNPKGHMEEFYSVFKETLKELSLNELDEKFLIHLNHRLTSKIIQSCLKEVGFKITKTEKSSFTLRFLDGTAFFSHSLVRYGFLEDWKKLIPSEYWDKVFTELETKVNDIAQDKGEFSLTIPVVYIEGEKEENHLAAK
jgi:ubiquinone/menaquinone biosynthesis C-methylase UbiE